MQIILKILQKLFFIMLTIFIKKIMETETVAAQVAEIQNKQPLFLPRGSVRALITLVMTLVVSGSFVWHYELPSDFYLLTIFAIGYYVGYRTDNTQIKEIKA